MNEESPQEETQETATPPTVKKKATARRKPKPKTVKVVVMFSFSLGGTGPERKTHKGQKLDLEADFAKQMEEQGAVTIV